MLASVVLARSLDTTDFAAYAFFQITASTLAAYSSLGIGITASKFFAEIGHKDSHGERLPIGTLWVLSIALALIGSGLLLLVPKEWLNAGLEVPAWIIALGALSIALGVVPGGAILGLEKYRQASMISAVSASAMLLGVWAAAVYQSATTGMVAIVLASSIQAIGESIVVIRVTGLQLVLSTFSTQWEDLKRLIDFAGPMILVSLLSVSGTWLLGRLILSSSDGERNFALYGIGLQWFAVVLVLPAMVSRVVLPRLVRKSHADDADSVKIVRYAVGLTAGSAFSILLIGLCLGPWLLSLYGSQYGAEPWLLAAFMAAAVLVSPANTLGNAIVSKNGQKAWLMLTLVWFAVLIGVGLALKDVGPWSGAIPLVCAAVALTTLSAFVARARRLI